DAGDDLLLGARVCPSPPFLGLLHLRDPPEELVSRVAESFGPRRASLRRGQGTEIVERGIGRLHLAPARARLECRRLRQLLEPAAQRLQAREVRLLELRALLLGLPPPLVEPLLRGREPALDGLDLRTGPVALRPRIPPARERLPRLRRRQRRGGGERLGLGRDRLEGRTLRVHGQPSLVSGAAGVAGQGQAA